MYIDDNCLMIININLFNSFFFLSIPVCFIKYLYDYLMLRNMKKIFM